MLDDESTVENEGDMIFAAETVTVEADGADHSSRQRHCVPVPDRRSPQTAGSADDGREQHQRLRHWLPP
ncbi:hypothetical protein ACB264_02915 [Klebsiella pneumoniae]